MLSEGVRRGCDCHNGETGGEQRLGRQKGAEGYVIPLPHSERWKVVLGNNTWISGHPSYDEQIGWTLKSMGARLGIMGGLVTMQQKVNRAWRRA